MKHLLMGSVVQEWVHYTSNFPVWYESCLSNNRVPQISLTQHIHLNRYYFVMHLISWLTGCFFVSQTHFVCHGHQHASWAMNWEKLLLS